MFVLIKAQNVEVSLVCPFLVEPMKCLTELLKVRGVLVPNLKSLGLKLGQSIFTYPLDRWFQGGHMHVNSIGCMDTLSLSCPNSMCFKNPATLSILPDIFLCVLLMYLATNTRHTAREKKEQH